MLVIEVRDGCRWLPLALVPRWPMAFLSRVRDPDRWRVRDAGTGAITFVRPGGRPGTVFTYREG